MVHKAGCWHLSHLPCLPFCQCRRSVNANTSRSWKVALTPENLTAAAIALLYTASIIAFFPEFFTTIGPLVRDIYIPVGVSIYIPVGVSFQALLEKPALPIWGVGDPCDNCLETTRPD